MEISSEKVMVDSKLLLAMTPLLTLTDNKLEEVKTFYYIGAILTKDGSCKTEIIIRLALATSAIIRLYVISYKLYGTADTYILS